MSQVLGLDERVDGEMAAGRKERSGDGTRPQQGSDDKATRIDGAIVRRAIWSEWMKPRRAPMCGGRGATGKNHVDGEGSHQGNQREVTGRKGFSKGSGQGCPMPGRSKMRTNEYNGRRNTEVKVTSVGQSGEVVGPDMHRYFL